MTHNENGEDDRIEPDLRPWRFGDIGFAGWWAIFRRVASEISKDNLGLIAAGVAFYALLAVFPAIVAFISLWGLITDPAQIVRTLDLFREIVPGAAYGIIEEQVLKVAGSHDRTLSLAALVGLLFAFFSASKGMKAMMTGLNVVYDEREKRNIFVQNIVAYTLTVATAGGVVLTLVFILGVPPLLRWLNVPEIFTELFRFLRWPAFFLTAVALLAVQYQFGPSRPHARWRWISIGSVVATVLWVALSAGFSRYVEHFGTYNEVYGSLGAGIVLLMWFWLSALVALLGAELNAEIENWAMRGAAAEKSSRSGEKIP